MWPWHISYQESLSVSFDLRYCNKHFKKKMHSTSQLFVFYLMIRRVHIDKQQGILADVYIPFLGEKTKFAILSVSLVNKCWSNQLDMNLYISNFQLRL